MSAGKELYLEKTVYCINCQKFSAENECLNHQLIQDDDLRYHLMEFQEKIKLNNFFLFMEQFYLGYEKLNYFQQKYQDLIKINNYLQKINSIDPEDQMQLASALNDLIQQNQNLFKIYFTEDEGLLFDIETLQNKILSFLKNEKQRIMSLQNNIKKMNLFFQLMDKNEQFLPETLSNIFQDTQKCSQDILLQTPKNNQNVSSNHKKLQNSNNKQNQSGKQNQKQNLFFNNNNNQQQQQIQNLNVQFLTQQSESNLIKTPDNSRNYQMNQNPVQNQFSKSNFQNINSKINQIPLDKSQLIQFKKKNDESDIYHSSNSSSQEYSEESSENQNNKFYNNQKSQQNQLIKLQDQDSSESSYYGNQENKQQNGIQNKNIHLNNDESEQYYQLEEEDDDDESYQGAIKKSQRIKKDKGSRNTSQYNNNSQNRQVFQERFLQNTSHGESNTQNMNNENSENSRKRQNGQARSYVKFTYKQTMDYIRKVSELESQGLKLKEACKQIGISVDQHIRMRKKYNMNVRVKRTEGNSRIN